MHSVEAILKMKYPYELYSGNKVVAKQEYLEYLKEFHPDKHDNIEKYNDATAIINNLYNEAIMLIDSGKWIEKNLIKIRSHDDKNYSMKFKIEHDFELGKLYIGSNSILYMIDGENVDFVDNAINVISNLTYADSNMEKEFKRYIPKVVEHFRTKDNKIALLIEKKSDVFSLRDILNFYNGKIPPRHVMWILSRLYNISCFVNYNGLTHNGITIDNYFISPLDHIGLLLGGWWYSVPIQNKMIGVSAEIYSIMPPDIKDSKRSSSVLDLESIRLIGRTLLGDKNGIELIEDEDIPVPLLNWVRGVSGINPIEEYMAWDKVIIESYGEKKFVNMEIDEKTLYEKLGGI